jgi:hypothetical protein
VLSQIEEEKFSKNLNHIILLLHNWKDKATIPNKIQKFIYIHLKEQEHYFTAVFKILERIFTPLFFDQEIKEFRKSYEKLNPKKSYRIKIWKLLIWITISSFFIAIGYLKFNKTEDYKKPLIHSDLPIPHDKVRLKRHNIMKKIEETLKGDQGIQIAVLVGMGGAGKTII